MSIQFPSDNVPSPRRKGGGGAIFLLIFIGIAFFVLRGLGSGGSAPPAAPNQPERREVNNASFPELEQGDSRRADASDWGTEDGPAQRNPIKPKSTGKTTNGDWGTEDGPTKQNKKSNSDFSLDTNPDSKLNSKPKKTTKGDWGSEEVD